MSMPESVSPLTQRPMENVELMLDVDQARERILSAFSPLPSVELSISEALGSVVARDVVAGTSVPPFANSAMDGYAVRAEDTAGASVDHPIRLQVIGEAAAGHP